MVSTILGMFEHPIEARRAMDRLRDSSLRIDDISIISRATESGKPISFIIRIYAADAIFDKLHRG
jgi:hypothetical protein